MAVARKFPNETRHQTALKYIKRAEMATTTTGNPQPPKQSTKKRGGCNP